MGFLIFLLICGIVVTIFGLILLKKEPEEKAWFLPIIGGAFIIGTILPLIFYESIPHNTFKTKDLPQIDTVITYTSINQQFDTTYIYTFKDE